MIVRRYPSVAALRSAHPWLAEREAEHDSLIAQLIRIEEGVDRATPYLAGTEHPALAVWSPGRRLILAGESVEAAVVLERAVAQERTKLTSVLGPPALARAFGEACGLRRNREVKTDLRVGVYVLRDVQSPDPMPPGSFRRMRDSERLLFNEWIHGFHRDTGLDLDYDAGVFADRFLGERRMWLWEHERPRSMAARVSKTWHGQRVSLVYTPPDDRGRGYAGAVVAALSQQLLDDGARFCCLHTDLGNPTSNALYRRLGYEQITELEALSWR